MRAQGMGSRKDQTRLDATLINVGRKLMLGAAANNALKVRYLNEPEWQGQSRVCGLHYNIAVRYCNTTHIESKT